MKQMHSLRCTALPLLAVASLASAQLQSDCANAQCTDQTSTSGLWTVSTSKNVRSSVRVAQAHLDSDLPESIMRAASSQQLASELPLQEFSMGVTEYRASIDVGTPAQKFNVLFDTGSFTMWLYGATCTSPACKGARDTYDVTKSRTGQSLNKPASQMYADGSGYNGTLVTDAVNVGGYNVSNFQFTQVTQYTSSSPSGVSPADDYQDGIVGMGFHPQVDGATNTLMEQLVVNGNLPYQQFSWYITADESQGFATFGGYDVTLFADKNGQPAWIPMITNDDLLAAGKLALPLTSASVDGQVVDSFNSHASPINGKLQGTTGAASWDTGTASSIVTDTLVMAIGSAIPGSKKVQFSGSKDISYIVPCSAKTETGGPQVTLNFFGGGSVTITALEYVEITTSGGGMTCFLALTGRPDGYRAGTYLIGNTFLKRYVNIFDFQKKWIGLTVALGRDATKGAAVQGSIKSINNGFSNRATNALLAGLVAIWWTIA
ncbi:aspartic peptidase domain-containing protein [Chytriomyces sp. MP71]|nr:aspartic peptidase domain-containing protein [Chytriomyces sp. MP71]